MIARAKPPKPQTLKDYLQQYLSERDVTREYSKGLGFSVEYLDRWAGHAIRLDELSDDLLNRWLIALGERMKPRSVKHHRINLVVLWRAAHDADLTTVGPRRVRKIKVPRVIPLAWTIAEMQAILRAASKVKGTFRYKAARKVKRCDFWRAYIMLAWDSGLRPSDLRIIRFDEIAADGTLVHVQSKTGDVKTCHLQPETVKAVQKLRGEDRERIFGDVLPCPDAIRRQFKAAVLTRAGLVGTPKKLRKSSASAVEAIQPGAATIHLGHRTPDMARAHYIDPRIAKPMMTRPPRLVGKGVRS